MGWGVGGSAEDGVGSGVGREREFFELENFKNSRKLGRNLERERERERGGGGRKSFFELENFKNSRKLGRKLK